MDDDEESVGLELELDALNPSSLTRKELSFGLGRGGRNDLDDDDRRDLLLHIISDC